MKKRRRWGQTAEDLVKAKIAESTGSTVAETTSSQDAENKRRRKRWGSDKDKIEISTNSVIAAAAANLSPEEAKALVCMCS